MCLPSGLVLGNYLHVNTVCYNGFLPYKMYEQNIVDLFKHHTKRNLIFLYLMYFRLENCHKREQELKKEIKNIFEGTVPELKEKISKTHTLQFL